MGIASSIKRNKITKNDFIDFKEIGRGGFSTVTCVTFKRNKGLYALKKTSIYNALNRCGTIDFLKNEIQILKEISSHPFIVNCQYAFHDYINCYLILDLIPGGDLRYRLDKKIIMTESELAIIALCLGSALQYIHSKNIIHRDIKPENIVLDRYGIPHLTDFGISYYGKTPEFNELLMCQLPSGTKPYMAPEMLTRSRLHGTAVDYWSLGITLFELKYGHRPFKSLPGTYIQYAKHSHYYEWYNTNLQPIVDVEEYDDEILTTIFNEQTIKTSQLFHHFIHQLLDIRIFHRLGGKECKNSFMNHEWIMEYSQSWYQMITKHINNKIESSTCYENKELVMKSEWYNEKYLQCRKFGASPKKSTDQSNSILSNDKDGKSIEELDQDIRKTPYYTPEIQHILDEYNYEATYANYEHITLEVAEKKRISDGVYTTSTETLSRTPSNMRRENEIYMSLIMSEHEDINNNANNSNNINNLNLINNVSVGGNECKVY
mmetsp:Transcript_14701/g.15401  ORF Transcript_14701/g.15401 Transcript_14701/m.15401 type:complete len:490 (+) Transcript_14701:156-1625(+)